MLKRGWTCLQILDKGKQSSREAAHIWRLEDVMLAAAQPKKQSAKPSINTVVPALLPVA